MKFRRRRYLILASLAVLIGLLGVTLSRTSFVRTASRISLATPHHRVATPANDLPNYKDVRADLQKERATLSFRYQHATVESERTLILDQVRQLLVQSLHDKIFPHWYGTPWDFNGTTETPNQGKIACGYFVSTVLLDLGLKVQRTRLAQQASENIILSLTTNAHVKRFRQVPINGFIDAIKKWGPGLYAVGLDNHVGFILNLADDVYFIHSSYVDPFCVIKERAVESSILTASRYRVLGRLTEDDQLLLKWLRGDQFMTRGV